MSTKKILARKDGPFYLGQDGTKYQAVWVDRGWEGLNVGMTIYLAKRTNAHHGRKCEFIHEVYPIILEPNSWGGIKTWFTHGRNALIKIDYFKHDVIRKFKE